MRRLLFFLFFITQVTGHGQSEKANQIDAYLDVNGSMNQYEYAYGELLKMLGKQYPKTNENSDGWVYLEGNREKALNDIKKLLIPVYDAHFDEAEVKKMIDFYESDTGKKLVTDRSQMTDVQKEELNTFFNSEVGQKIIDKQPILTTEISAASENWSRDLYETALSLLK